MSHTSPVGAGASIRRRVCAVIAVLGVLLWARLPPTQAEAAWVHAEHGSSEFSALTVAPVTVSGCTVSSGVLGALGSFIVTFQLPAGYAIANASYAVANNATMTGATIVSPTVSGPSGGSYTATFGTGLLGLLGANAYLGVRITHASGWTSTYRVAHGVVSVLAVDSSCTVL